MSRKPGRVSRGPANRELGQRGSVQISGLLDPGKGLISSGSAASQPTRSPGEMILEKVPSLITRDSPADAAIGAGGGWVK